MTSQPSLANLPTGTVLFHHQARNADGSALRCRVSGRIRTWKRRPDYFELPVKYGFKTCFYITPQNASEWLFVDPTV